MPTIPPGLQAALQALDQSLDAPRRPGIPLGNWRWLVRQRMGTVRDVLVGEAAGSDDGWLAARAGSVTVEIDSSHVAFISHPDETVDLIVAAVKGSA